MYEAVIFDVDGTIVDTRYIVDAVAEAFYQLHGRRLTEKDREFIYGATQKATLSFLNITPGEMPCLPKFSITIWNSSSTVRGCFPAFGRL